MAPPGLAEGLYIYVYTHIYVYAHIEDLSAGAVYCPGLILKCSKHGIGETPWGGPPGLAEGLYIDMYTHFYLYVCMHT